MTTNSNNVRVAGSGEISMASYGATAPTGTASAITGFTGLGLVTSDGVTESRSRDTTDLQAWQNGANVRTLVTGGTMTYQFVLWETKKETVELYYGTSVTQTSTEGSYVVVPTSTGGRRAFIVDTIDGANLHRDYIPNGEVTDVGDKVYKNDDAVGYDVTITCYPDPSILDANGRQGSIKAWDTSLKSGA